MKFIIKSFLFIVLALALVFWAREKGMVSLKWKSDYPTTAPKTEQGVGAVVNERKAISDQFSGTTDDIISLVNQSRAKEGKQILEKNLKLTMSATLKAQDMRQKGYFDHVSPEGLQPWFFVEKSGYNYKTVGENLAEGFFSAQDVHEAWMNSEGHRKNVLSEDFEEIGIAVVEFEQNGLRSYIAVQHFGAQFDAAKLEVKNVCDPKAKEYCSDAKIRLKEVEDVIKKQEKIITKAKKSKDVEKSGFEEAEDNLGDLEKIEDEIKDYLEKCEEYISNCDLWQ